MEQLGTLWKYQELDLLMDQYILEKKNSDLRKQLLKIKNYLIQQEKNLIELDCDATQRNQLLAKLQEEYNAIGERIRGKIGKMESEGLESLAELEELTKEGIRLQDRIRKKEEELKKLNKELNSFINKIQDIRQRVSNAKKDYTEVKKEYDIEVAGVNKELKKLKSQRDKIGASVNKELMTKYKNIKASRTPVMSPLIGNQCDGCNMILASLMIQKVKAGKRIVECENCGRILFDGDLI